MTSSTIPDCKHDGLLDRVRDYVADVADDPAQSFVKVSKATNNVDTGDYKNGRSEVAVRLQILADEDDAPIEFYNKPSNGGAVYMVK